MINPKKKVIFLRAAEIHREPRAEKEIALLTSNYNVEVLCWDRHREAPKTEEKNGYLIHRCHSKGKYGGGLKNIFFMLGWWFCEFFWLMKNSFDVVHVCDFDAYFPALLAAKLKGKKIIYDIFDFYGDMIGTPGWFRSIIKKIDLFLIQFANGVIVTDDNRINQIKGSNPRRVTVIYNTPPDFYDKFKKNIEDKRKSDIFTFGYIGKQIKTPDDLWRVLIDTEDRNIAGPWVPVGMRGYVFRYGLAGQRLAMAGSQSDLEMEDIRLETMGYLLTDRDRKIPPFWFDKKEDDDDY